MMMTSARSGSSIDQIEIRFLVEKNADGIIVVDDDGVVLFANPAAEEIFGRRSEMLIGSPIGIPVLASDTTEIAIHRPGGDQVDAEVRIVETTWEHRPARLATLRDVSARRAVEERQRHAAKMEAIGQLTAGIAHDFNNLLTVVLGNLESAQRKSTSGDPALRRALENATAGARRAAVLTARLLAFARRKPLEPRPLDVNVLLSGLCDLLQRTLGEGVEVRTVLAADLWIVEIDPAELETSVLNLAVNARDAMAASGKLVIETENVELDSADANNADIKAGAYVRISVTDTGAGMTPDVLRRVFEPFFTTKAHGQGTGLGLSQVYGFVRQSGGQIKIYSDPGMGTTARIYLPKASEALRAHQPQSAEPKILPHQAARSAFGEMILVVEDDDDVRNYTVGSLRELGYVVFEAIEAASALDIIEREPGLRLLFTDLGLPGGVNGRTLADRARQVRPSLSVLITTAYAGSALIHKGRVDPEIELLNKPFTFVALATRIRDLLDRDRHKDLEGLSILVVEDESLLRMLVLDALADAGYPTKDAASFHEAMTTFRSVGESLAAAIIDLGLPDRPGDELISEIRVLRPEMPIILATGFADQHIRQRFAGDARIRIVTKPFNPNDVIAVLQEFGIRRSTSK